jgi:hypothetical protein
MMPPVSTMHVSVSMGLTGFGEALAAFQQVQGLQSPQGTLTPPLGVNEVQNRLAAALQASESVPGLVSPEDAAKIRGFIQAGNHAEALQRLSVYQSVLELVHDECTQGMPAAAKLPLERIAGLFGFQRHEFENLNGRLLEANRPRSTALPFASDSAPDLELLFDGTGPRHYTLEKEAAYGHVLSISIGRDPQNGAQLDNSQVSLRHAKISFYNGRYWLEDQGSTNGTYYNGRRLSRYEQQELKNGDRLQIGSYVMTAKLPYQLRLQDLADMLRDAPSYRAIFAVLKNKGFEEIDPKIRDIVTGPLTIGERLAALRREVPYDGGLLLKLEALLLRGEVVRLRSLYFPKMTPEQALETGVRLTASLAQAQSFADLAERLRRTNAEGFKTLIEKLERFEREGLLFVDIPEVFGLRDQAKRLFLEGLSIDADQRQDLQWRQVTPDLLDERPWKKISVAPLLQKHLDPFQGAIGKRLNIGQWQQLEKTLTGAFANERDEPELKDDAQVDVRPGATQFVLYDKYQVKAPSTDTGGTLTESQTESKKTVFFDRILERLVQDKVGVHPDGYWFFGGSYGVRPRFEGRIYLSLKRRNAEAIFRYLAKDVQGAVTAQGGKIQFKIAGNPEGYARSDAGVIYFHAKDQKTVLAAIQKMHREHPEFFKPGNPLFTMPLLEGLSFGEHPLHESVSFGSLRTEAMTTAVRVARALMGTKAPPDWEEIRQMCAYFLKRAGVDIENPSFNEGGQEKFGPILAFTDESPKLVMARPKPLEPAPVAAPAPAVTPVDAAATGLLIFELHQRYPALREDAFLPLVKRMADNMMKRWQLSDAAPGKSAKAPSMIPEEMFEAEVKVVIETMEKGAYNPRVRQLLAAMKSGDRGPRVVRALEAKLQRDLPPLREPDLVQAAHALAVDIHKHWQDGKVLTAAALEACVKLKLTGLRNHFRAHPSPKKSVQNLQAFLELFLSA